MGTLGMFLVIQATAREMIKREIRGSIAMTASMSGTVANKGKFKIMDYPHSADSLYCRPRMYRLQQLQSRFTPDGKVCSS